LSVPIKIKDLPFQITVPSKKSLLAGALVDLEGEDLTGKKLFFIFSFDELFYTGCNKRTLDKNSDWLPSIILCKNPLGYLAGLREGGPS
jgi:hypothetical protein